jgi:anti-anti-sigma factor
MVPVGFSYLTVPNRARAPGVDVGGDPAVVWLAVEHDISTDGALRRALARAISLDATALVIGLSELEFMSASTLGTIVRAREYLRCRSGSLTVRSAPPMARRIIDICGLNDLLGPTVDDASRPSWGALGSWVAVGVAEPPHRQPGSTAELIGDRCPAKEEQSGARPPMPSRRPEGSLATSVRPCAKGFDQLRDDPEDLGSHDRIGVVAGVDDMTLPDRLSRG